MGMHGIEGLPALFFDNLQKTIRKLVWKFYKMTNYTTSSTTRKILAMNYQNIFLKYKRRDQTSLFMYYLFEKMQKILQITENVYWAYGHCW